MNDQIYLDYNATAPLRPECLSLITSILSKPHNASSVHGFGRAGRSYIEKAREHVAALVGVPANQIIFNSGATEANNTVLRHFAGESILVSAIEHLSILEGAQGLIRIPVTAQGVINLEAYEALLKEHKPSLVSVMLVNNETGAIQPIQTVSALARKYGAMIHCDGVQAAGRMTLNLAELGVDFMSLSSHKIGGPQGVGALALGLCGITPTLLYGGGQEKSARAGTENVAGIAGFGEAARLAQEGLGEFQALESMRNQMEDELLKIAPDLIIHAKDAPRVANTSMFSLPGAKAETLMMSFDLEGIALSNGSACSSGSVKASYVLEAMGHSANITTSALRVSLGHKTKGADIDALLNSFKTISARIKR